MRKTYYDLSDQELVNHLVNAALKAGQANSGLAIDITAGFSLEHVAHIKGCLLARLNGVKPEIEPETEVSVVTEQLVQGCNLRGYSYEVPKLITGVYTVSKVWYFRNKWYLELKGHSTAEGSIALYPADQFIINQKALNET